MWAVHFNQRNIFTLTTYIVYSPIFKKIILLHSCYKHKPSSRTLTKTKVLIRRVIMAMSGNIFGCHSWGESYWHLAGRSQGSCGSFYSAQDSLHNKELSSPKKSRVITEKSGCKHVTEGVIGFIIYLINKDSMYTSFSNDYSRQSSCSRGVYAPELAPCSLNSPDSWRQRNHV